MPLRLLERPQGSAALRWPAQDALAVLRAAPAVPAAGRRISCGLPLQASCRPTNGQHACLADAHIAFADSTRLAV
jgi:hypothetical protein